MTDLLVGTVVTVIGLLFAVGSFYLANVDKKDKYETWKNKFRYVKTRARCTWTRKKVRPKTNDFL